MRCPCGTCESGDYFAWPWRAYRGNEFWTRPKFCPGCGSRLSVVDGKPVVEVTFVRCPSGCVWGKHPAPRPSGWMECYVCDGKGVVPAFTAGNQPGEVVQ